VATPLISVGYFKQSNFQQSTAKDSIKQIRLSELGDHALLDTPLCIGDEVLVFKQYNSRCEEAAQRPHFDLEMRCA